MSTPLATLEQGGCKAEIYEEALPGQFSIRYFGPAGVMLAEEPLTGVSSYHQREQEILARLQELCAGGQPASAELSDPGEY
ncbi:MAG: hypothetical protein JO022_05255 [Acidobacteriaceae bacterium]|nr:hypothetical protein [Acidobacteriaceae bacterium]